MIERKIEIEKDNIRKSVDENIVSLYLNMGWKKVNYQEEIAEKVKSKSISKKSIKGL